MSTSLEGHVLPYLGVCHLFFLVIIGFWCLKDSVIDNITKLLIVLILCWTNIVLTSLFLSAFSTLNNPILYASFSVTLAIPLSLFFAGQKFRPTTDGNRLHTIVDDSGFFSQILIRFLVITLVMVGIANFIIALSYLPNNPDSLTYRLSRIYFYHSNGSIDHFATGIDPRLIYYPFNGSLLQMPIIQYRWPWNIFPFVSLAAWFIVGLTLYRILTILGFSMAAIISSVWLTCLTPGVVIQATSTNDEILAAFVLLIAVYFYLRFLYTKDVTDLSILVMSVGLSVGTKLHAFFFWPLLVISLFVLKTDSIIAATKNMIRSKRSICMFTFAFTISAVLAVAFMWPNWRASGEVMDVKFASDTLNTPFKLVVGLQNTALHTIQIVMAPVADLLPISDWRERSQVYSEINNVFAPALWWVQNGREYTAFYSFSGVLQSDAAFMSENSVSIGFIYIVIIVALMISIRRKLTYGIIFSTAAVVWYVTYCMMTRYIEPVNVYVAFAFMVCSPAVAFALISTSYLSDIMRKTLLIFVVATHSLLDLNVLLYNVTRNLREAFSVDEWPISRFPIEKSIARAISKASCTRFANTHWEIPYAIMMAPVKGQSYFIGDVGHAQNSKCLNILSFQQKPIFEGFVPVRVPNKEYPGLALIGAFESSYGSEWAFGSGKQPKELFNKYIVLKIAQGDKDIRVEHHVYGLDSRDKLEFFYRFEPRIPRTALPNWSVVSDWATTPDRTISKPDYASDVDLIIGVRERSHPEHVTYVRYPVGDPLPFNIETHTNYVSEPRG
jgi:hypothetical protein